MKIRLLFTKSNTSFSKLIRFVTKEDCSHFSYAFDDDGVGFESNLLGTHPIFLKTSLKKHNIVHEIPIEISTEQYDRLWNGIIDKFDGCGYDYCGALYLGLYKFLKTRFKVKMPDKNKWASPDLFWCDETFDSLNELPQLPRIKVSGSMMSPHDLYLALSKGMQ